MKKLLFMFVLMFGLSFVSCGNSTDSSKLNDSTKVDTTLVDTMQVDSTVDSLHA